MWTKVGKAIVVAVLVTVAEILREGGKSKWNRIVVVLDQAICHTVVSDRAMQVVNLLTATFMLIRLRAWPTQLYQPLFHQNLSFYVEWDCGCCSQGDYWYHLWWRQKEILRKSIFITLVSSLHETCLRDVGGGDRAMSSVNPKHDNMGFLTPELEEQVMKVLEVFLDYLDKNSRK